MAVPRPRPERHGWSFTQNASDDVKRTRALEYTAHYLDRIDQSLERIATALESGGGNEQLRLQLMNIEKAILKSTGQG